MGFEIPKGALLCINSPAKCYWSPRTCLLLCRKLGVQELTRHKSGAATNTDLEYTGLPLRLSFFVSKMRIKELSQRMRW